MKARIKATGKEIIVEPYGDEFAQIFPDGDYKVYTKQELVFSNETDWQHYRIKAAIANQQAILSNYDYFSHGIRVECNEHEKKRTQVIAEMAVELADALIAELQKKQD